MDINFIDGQIFELTGKLVSCVVSVLIVYRFFDGKYLHVYRSKSIYMGIKIVGCLANVGSYLLNNALINISFWIIFILLISKFFYFDEGENKIKYYFTNIAFVFACSICEAIGGALMWALIQIAHLDPSDAMISFVNNIGGASSTILLYYLILKRLFISETTRKISVGQYTIYVAVTSCVLINIGEILFFFKFDFSSKDYIFLMIDMIFMILINLYLFYMMDTTAENRDLRYKLALYEQQAQSNYDYYARQIESNKTVMKVMHDLRKHMRVMEGLKQYGNLQELQDYVNSFEDMISPLLMRKYCNNVILNTILTDKVGYCEKNSIHFQIDIQNVDIDFMKPIDITTLFGNVLDNAIEACEKADEKQISLKIYPFNQFVYIQLTNSFDKKIKYDNKGRPLSDKGKYHGIGLENVENVVRDYNGHIQFTIEEWIFFVEIMFSHP
ncbi:MAG: GHKL domain-containing protein [Lachnospiraceae bacterium]|nr:GHKL domain-containing protein [Lachnospiraceae bacterium]